MNRLKIYNKKRDFDKTDEPIGKIDKKSKKRFCVQHHIARKDHYDFRLEYKGVLISFAIPKGPSYNSIDKRLAIHVEDHPTSYINFEGIIKEGYGKGSVMLWDIGIYSEIEKFDNTYKKGYLKFKLNGKRLKGIWTLVKFKDDNWLLIKEKDGIKLFDNINKFDTSIKSNKTMDEIRNEIIITNPNKVIKDNITKIDIVNYYKKVYNRMSLYLNNRIISTIRYVNNDTFFKRHFSENKYLNKVKNKDYYYINNNLGLISEVQMNSYEFHINNSDISDLKHPNIMIFDLDPDENLDLEKVRDCTKNLKEILDKLNLKSYLKTSGGKGYHVVVPLYEKMTWNKVNKIAKSIVKIMINKFPDKYTDSIRIKNRKNKVFIDYFRNKENASCVAPYSLRIRDKITVSMPIKWSELYKVKPDEIDINNCIKRLKKVDPWKSF